MTHTPRQIESIKDQEEFNYQSDITKQKLNDEQSDQIPVPVTPAIIPDTYNPSC